MAPLFILIAAISFLTHIVFQFQRELDNQASEAGKLEARIGKLIATQAGQAAPQLGGEGLQGKTVDVTLYIGVGKRSEAWPIAYFQPPWVRT